MLRLFTLKHEEKSCIGKWVWSIW